MDCQPVCVSSSTAAESTVGSYRREAMVALRTMGFDNVVRRLRKPADDK